MSFFTPKSYFDSTSPDLYNTQDLRTQGKSSESAQLSQSTFQSQLSQSTFQSQLLSNFTIQVETQNDLNIFGSQQTPFFNQSRLSFSQDQNGEDFEDEVQAELTFCKNNSQLFDEASEEMETEENEAMSNFFSAVPAESSSTSHRSSQSQTLESFYTLQQETQSSQQMTSFNIASHECQTQQSSLQTQQQSQDCGSYFTTEKESQCSQRAASVIVINDDDEATHEINEVHVPASIRELHKEVKESYSDWVFISLITDQLCTDWFPSSAYHNLKLCLLLSLVSIDQSPPIPIIALGQETSHANIIMKHVGKFADRFVTSTLSDFDKPTIKPNGTIEAGPLLMAKGGVLAIGDWSRLNQKAVWKLLREIETGAVTTEKVQQSVPLECSIWSYWSVSAKAKRDFSDINQFLNVFGIPVMIDDLNEEIEEDIINDLLSSVCNRKQIIPDNDLKRYLKFASAQHVAMESIAEDMLNKYFKSTRAFRPDALSSQALTVLKQLAESHAKLCLRNIVNCSDVLAAINICEKYIRVLFTTGSHSSPAEPSIHTLGEIDVFQAKLYEWFECFTRDNKYC